jgi:predicted permease
MAMKKARDYNLAGSENELPEVAAAQNVSASFFPLLGVQPALGRFFTAADDTPEANATVVLSFNLWKRRYAGDPAIIGKDILLDARPYTVIGVLPAWFNYPDTRVALWTPIYHERAREFMQMHDAHNFDVIARLKPGVSIAKATAELNTIQQGIRKRFPNGPINDAANIRPILDGETRDLKTGLYTLLAATGCLLLIACLSIANLLVARAATRRRETAIRLALGSSRMRLIREQVIESVLLSCAGGIFGLLLAASILQWLMHTRQDIPRVNTIHIDGTAILFAIGIVLVSGIFSGLIPAFSTNDKQVLRTLNESSRSYSGGSASVRLRRMLLSLQVGLTFVLLIGAGLLLESYHHLRNADLGCATSNVLTMHLHIPKGRYVTSPQMADFYDQLLNQARALHGVDAAGLTNALPGEGRVRDDVFTILEHPPLPQGQTIDADTRFVDPGYFSAMQIPLLQGRFFHSNERLDQVHSVIINHQFARTLLPGENPIGKHIVGGSADTSQNYEIVGVVGDTLEEVAEPPYPAMFYPLDMAVTRDVALALRGSPGRDPLQLAIPAQQAIAHIDPDLPVTQVLTMDQFIGTTTIDASFDATLLLAFALLSLVLAAVGLFGVLSYIVAQRTAEIGIRIALGAQRKQVVQLILINGLQPAIFGLFLGLLASIGVNHLIQSMLYGTPALDVAVFAIVSATLMLVAVIACAVPAWRASQLDPITALRME